ncbi:glycosyltransferase [Alcanivorax sp. S6407]|uniref:glycosyltransferase n=1 Tax=Alcanivorax sp. S6407 TaxID=2926424 RepID=UPI001FF1889A|nr:glycosyltransferase [Alcanivorax sp. S6407]MCK0152814.1 glycosyltransferase [Alcanivorax sp. S6407]
MKILFNCLVNVKGGAIQNAANFVAHALNDSSNQFQFLISPQVMAVLDGWGVSDPAIHVLDHPLKSKSVRVSIAAIEREFCPDVVYSMAGPTYFRFSSPHVLGISDGFITHATRDIFFKGRSLTDGAVFYLKTLLKRLYSRFEGDYFIFQTDSARKGYCSSLCVPAKKSAVVANAIGKSFLAGFQGKGSVISSDVVRILCPAADYPHKNLDLLFPVCDLLSEGGAGGGDVQVRFVVTVDKRSGLARRIEQTDFSSMSADIVNIGPYSYDSAPEIYRESEIVFMPTLLETFSTSYLEALAAKKVLLCSDRDFARDVCEDAAYYFDPNSPEDAVNVIHGVLEGRYAFDESKAERVINKYGDFSIRYFNLLDTIRGFLGKGD